LELLAVGQHRQNAVGILEVGNIVPQRAADAARCESKRRSRFHLQILASDSEPPNIYRQRKHITC